LLTRRPSSPPFSTIQFAVTILPVDCPCRNPQARLPHVRQRGYLRGSV
jgi:hypothetical protein